MPSQERLRWLRRRVLSPSSAHPTVAAAAAGVCCPLAPHTPTVAVAAACVVPWLRTPPPWRLQRRVLSPGSAHPHRGGCSNMCCHPAPHPRPPVAATA
eukprot:366240-Chlamydomonas_euryale.AAC.12